jgi:hypothetical protein
MSAFASRWPKAKLNRGFELLQEENMLRFFHILVVLSLVLSYIPLQPVPSIPSDALPDPVHHTLPADVPGSRVQPLLKQSASLASPIADGLNNFVGVLNQLGSLDQLGLPLPLTNLGQRPRTRCGWQMFSAIRCAAS